MARRYKVEVRDKKTQTLFGPKVRREFLVVGGKGRIWARTPDHQLADKWRDELNQKGYIEA